MGAIALEGLIEEVSVKEPAKAALSVLRDHPHFLTREKDPYGTNTHMADWPIPLISRHKPMSLSMFPKHARMASFPVPLITSQPSQAIYGFRVWSPRPHGQLPVAADQPPQAF